MGRELAHTMGAILRTKEQCYCKFWVLLMFDSEVIIKGGGVTTLTEVFLIETLLNFEI